MNEDLRELLNSFNSHSVDYLIIGAHALAFHGYPRFTEDLDVWIRKSEQNATSVVIALKEFGIQLEPAAVERFLADRSMVRLGHPPHRVDITNFAGELEFDAAWGSRIEADFDGVVAHVLSREDFIKSKRSAGRPKDLRDLEEMGESL
ncbi:MAG: DUF6036 family nucleotidyltransferase [Fimbriimonadaceae bacterium]